MSVRRFLAGLVLLLALPFSPAAFAQDSLDTHLSDVLLAKLDEYVPAIQALPLAQQDEEVDFLISSCKDKSLRERVAEELFHRFHDSKIMGSENVAVHIYDRWFADGTLSFSEAGTELAARIFAEFNRASLIGAKAGSIVLEDAEDREFKLEPGSSGRPCVLFFYDVDCPKCRIESIMLRNILENADYPVDVYLICLALDKDAWTGYVESNFDMDLNRTAIWNLRASRSNPDCLNKYGIMQTPRMFLVDAEGTVVGRQLSSTVLDRMLSAMFKVPELEYGSDESANLYDNIFSSFDGVGASDVMAVADHIGKRTLVELKDTTLFRQMTGDLLYYLTNRKEEGFRMARGEFARKDILDRPDIWKTADDSLKVVSLALLLESVSLKTPLGETVPDLCLPGVLHDRWDAVRLHREREWRLRRLKADEVIVIFHLEGCGDFRAEIEAVPDYIATHRKSKILLVDLQKATEADPSLPDSFDLSSTPFLVSFDRKGRVLRKYFTIASR